jgi:hypothetical protein
MFSDCLSPADLKDMTNTEKRMIIHYLKHNRDEERVRKAFHLRWEEVRGWLGRDCTATALAKPVWDLATLESAVMPEIAPEPVEASESASS